MQKTEAVDVMHLPAWAAGSYRAFVEQAIFIRGFPLCVFPHNTATPFAKEFDGWHFVYMTNRSQGRYTYVFEKEPHLSKIG